MAVINKIRFRYSRTGKAKYISHLDLMSVMQRAFLRSGVKLKYSEGFNPHPYMSVALPLPVGCESLCELLDTELTDDTIPDIKKINLPDGLILTQAYKPSRKFNEIVWIEITGSLYYDKSVDDVIIEKLKCCFAGDSVMISKRTKRGQKELNIAPFIKNIDFTIENSRSAVVINARITAQNPTINIGDLINALDKDLNPVYSEMKRIDVYDGNMVLFN